MKSKSKYIDNLKNLVAEYLTKNNQNSNHRSKRGVLNFVGEISKILFGTMTQADAGNYNKQITELENEQRELSHLSNEQMTIIKTTITSVNSTLQKVNQNEKILTKGFNELLNYSTHKFSELQEEIRNVNVLNEQFRLIQRGVDESQHSFDIDRCICSRRTRDTAAAIDNHRENQTLFGKSKTAKWPGLS
jgi:hypothetical protein